MCALAGIVMLTRFNSVRVGHGEALLLVTVLACFLGGVDPFGGFGRVAPVFVSLLILQTLSSGLNLLGANQHLATAVWGLFLVAVMAARSVWAGRLLQMMFARRFDVTLRRQDADKRKETTGFRLEKTTHE
jgi:simple sugar transport system permease protein